MDQLFAALSFFATDSGILLISATVGAMILFWDWRVTLPGLVVVQTGVLALAVARSGLPADWAGLQTVVMVIIATMLAISVVQTSTSRSLQQAGNWVLRLLAVLVVFLAWRVIDVTIPIPELAPDQMALFTWLALAMLLMLGLSDNPLFAAVALLLWFIPAQVVIGALTGHAGLFAIIGGLEIMVALAASYLTLADRWPTTARRLVMTDIVFPDQFDTPATALNGNQLGEELTDAAPLPDFLQGIVDAIDGVERAPNPHDLTGERRP